MVEFTKIMGGILILFIFLGGGLWFIGDNISTGNIEETDALKNETSALAAVRDTLNSSYTSQRDQYGDMVEGEISDENALDFMIGNGFRALIRIVDTFKVIDNVIQRLAIQMHIPAFIIDAAVVFVLASITLTIIYMMFRFQPK